MPEWFRTLLQSASPEQAQELIAYMDNSEDFFNELADELEEVSLALAPAQNLKAMSAADLLASWR